MIETLECLDSVVSILVATLVLLQTIVNFVLPPEKAERFNYIGKTLDFLAKTKGGLSIRSVDGNNGNDNKPSNPTNISS